ncbi:hypothetical protein ASE63_22380 [Bosea sp. Root381]|uniref:hypothetical protein n=1 Tax=Bosea sp. Root381 TaxID=1736524 RepID=UPI0007158B9E|nr:hypothetical protein [Bosea sp. Root381]KRE07449.1 hypothetical protein ASE63_22380 [Bosea sp. Root381]
MAYHLKNLSHFPLDVPSLNGPMILPAYGEITADLSAYEAEVMRHSQMVEISDADEAEPDIDDLRKQYADLVGEQPDKRWGAPRLQSEIDKALAA